MGLTTGSVRWFVDAQAEFVDDRSGALVSLTLVLVDRRETGSLGLVWPLGPLIMAVGP